MKHRWDYGRSDARNSRQRWCKACWATGSRFGPGSTLWSTVMPDGSRTGEIVPPCPGTPWVERRGYWEIAAGPGSHSLIVTSMMINMNGRPAIERVIEEHGSPPLPAAAWEVLEAR